MNDAVRRAAHPGSTSPQPLTAVLLVLLTTALAPTSAPAGPAADEALPGAPTTVRATQLQGVEASVSALLLSGQRGGSVEGAQLWGVDGLSSDGNHWLVPILIEVDGGDLLAGLDGRRLPVAVYVFAVDREGRIADHLAQGLLLTVREHATLLASGGLRFRGRLELPPGMYSVRVMVRNHATGRYYQSWTAVRLPSPEGDDLLILPPVLTSSGTEWLEALQSGQEEDAPFVPGGPVRPGALATVVSGRPAPLIVGVAGWATDQGRLSLSISNEQGRTVAEPPVAVADDAAGAAGPMRFLELEMDAVDLPAGEYTAVLTAESDDGDRGTRSLPLRILDEQRVMAWTALDAAPPPPTADTRVAREEEERIKRKEMRQLYLEAVAHLAEGESRRAVAGVADMERRATVDLSRGLPLLQRMEAAEAARLAGRDPRALAPLAALHRELYRVYVARHEAVLAGHSWKIATQLGELAGRRQPDQIPEGFAEAVMVGLASDLVQASALMSARSLLDRTLAMSPDNPAALLALGAVHERAAEYQEAVHAFRRLVRSDPGHPEGRLRLAVNVRRLGERRQAREILRELLRDAPPSWIAALAYQELASSLEADGELESAHVVLQEGAERLPSNQRLQVQLAHVLDQLGRPWDAIRILEDLDRRRSEEGDTPRVLYGQWPSLGPEVSQAWVSRVARELLPGLQRALGVGDRG